MRSYSKLFTVSFPIMLRSLINGAKDVEFNILVEKSFKYFFNFEIPDSTQTENEDMQIDDDEITELSLFAGMRKNQPDKPKYPLQTP